MFAVAATLLMMLGVTAAEADIGLAEQFKQARKDQFVFYKKYQLKKAKYLRRNPMVEATTGQEVINYNNPQTINDYFALADSFNEGAKIETFLPFAPICTDSLRKFLNDLEGTNANTSADAW
jgi:hypothetical protein